MTRSAPSVSSYVLLCAIAAALSTSTTTCEAFAPAFPSVVAHNVQSIYSATALNAQKKRRRKRKVAPNASEASASAAAPAAPASAEKADGAAAAAPAKLDAAAELKAAEMAFDLGADGFVGE